jgi:hypothetical protein
VYFTLRRGIALSAVLACALMMRTPAFAETAYIAQVNPKSSSFEPMASQRMQLVAASQGAPRQTSFAPTPEAATPVRNGNFAQTTQVGTANAVFQVQSGGGNVSNVGIWGGKNNDVGVWQGGRDLSNINLINTQGMAVEVIQPPGSAPLNMLIARLPNGALLIKR